MTDRIEPELSRPLGPTTPTERYLYIDILRGVALFGVLLVNMEYFVSPSYRATLAINADGGLIDQLAIWSARFLAEGKFYTLFSFLLGYGVAMQMARAAARRARFAPVYARRLTILLLIGVYHGSLLWVGDVLLPYAVLGFILLLFRHRSGKTLLIVGVCCVFASTVLLSGLLGLVEVARLTPMGNAEIEAALAKYAIYEKAAARQALQVYSQGPPADILARHLRDWGQVAIAYVFVSPNILAMFLFGLYAGRRRILEKAPSNPGLAGKVLAVTLPLGLAGNAAHTLLVEYAYPVGFSWWAVADTAVISVSAPVLTASYIAVLALLFQKPRWQKRLAPLAAVGRTALSNYLLQSVICTTIACSYGLALYGNIRPPVGILLAIAIYSVQVWFSTRWLSRFRFGPFEWLWRSLTYRRWQPMSNRPRNRVDLDKAVAEAARSGLP